MPRSARLRLQVPEGESILSVALDKGIDLPHDCKLGVCMTCPAKLVGSLGRASWLGRGTGACHGSAGCTSKAGWCAVVYR